MAGPILATAVKTGVESLQLTVSFPRSGSVIPLTVAGVFLCLAVFYGRLALAQGSAFEQVRDSTIRKLDDGLLGIGEVILDKKTGVVRVLGAVNMQSGLIEYFAVARGGKTHESVLVLTAEPIHIQTALLLLGLQGGEAIEFQGDSAAPAGDQVAITVEWEDTSGAIHTVRAEDMIYDLSREGSMPNTHWVFTGSRIVDSVFMAQIDRSIVATYHDPYAIIDNPLPGGADDTVYRVNEESTPVPGTPVIMTITVLRNEDKASDD